jgi:uncharacterized membrane protein
MRGPDESNRSVGWLTVAAGAALGVGAYYFLRARQSEQHGEREASGMPDPYLTESLTINQPIERVYEAWRNLESVAFMRAAEIIEAREQEMCAWRAASGTVGRVEFRPAPAGRGTEVHLHLERQSRLPGEKLARVLGMAPDQQIREDLRRFKQLLETGEMTVSDGPGLWRPAQPPSSTEQVTAFTGV